MYEAKENGYEKEINGVSNGSSNGSISNEHDSIGR